MWSEGSIKGRRGRAQLSGVVGRQVGLTSAQHLSVKGREEGMKKALIVSLFLCLRASLAHAGLEVPTNGSNQSGIGDISGWFCNNGTYTYTIDNGPASPLVYGTNRNDTIGPCGDANNGIIQQFNWNLIPSGQHTIRIFFNGQLIDQATFTSTNIGAEFLTGAAGSVSTILAGRDVTLTWQQSQQNYVITSVSAGGGGLNDLSSLIGTWLFSYTIISTFTNTYDLQTLTTIDGVPTLIGEDEFGGGVIANKVQDLSPGSSLPYTFALLDPGSIICRFFVFNHTSTNVVNGVYAQFDADNFGNCTNKTSGNTYAMTGSRISAIVQVKSQVDQNTLEQQSLSEDMQIHALTTGENELDEMTELMSRMQQRMAR